MIDRKTQIEQLLEKLHSLKRLMTPESSEATSAECPSRPQPGEQVAGVEACSPPFQVEERLAASQWLVLHQVGHQNGIGLKELAASLGISSSAATQLVDGLVKKDLLVRQPSEADRRALHLSLPKESRKRIEAMMQHRLESMIDLFGVLDDTEFQALLDLLNKVITRTKIKKEVV